MAANFESSIPQTEGFTLFYGHTGTGNTRFFSNFFPAEFSDPDFFPELEQLQQYKYREKQGVVAFHHVEQYMHACKAVVFKDFDTLDKIMKQGEDQKESKMLGRQVQNFVDPVWQDVSRAIVTRGIMLKFGQNKELGEALEGTGETLLVECAPRDLRYIWVTSTWSAENLPEYPYSSYFEPKISLFGNLPQEKQGYIQNCLGNRKPEEYTI